MRFISRLGPQIRTYWLSKPGIVLATKVNAWVFATQFVLVRIYIETMIAPDAPRPVRAGEELDLNRLNAYLREDAPEVGMVLEVQQFPGGFSNLTYWLKTADQEYVLRRPPVGANIKGGHDMGREFRVLSLLKGHYDKIPEPVVYCETPDVLGAPFYIMKRVSGIILRASMATTLNTRTRADASALRSVD